MIIFILGFILGALMGMFFMIRWFSKKLYQWGYFIHNNELFALNKWIYIHGGNKPKVEILEK